MTASCLLLESLQFASDSVAAACGVVRSATQLPWSVAAACRVVGHVIECWLNVRCCCVSFVLVCVRECRRSPGGSLSVATPLLRADESKATTGPME